MTTLQERALIALSLVLTGAVAGLVGGIIVAADGNSLGHAVVGGFGTFTAAVLLCLALVRFLRAEE